MFRVIATLSLLLAGFKRMVVRQTKRDVYTIYYVQRPASLPRTIYQHIFISVDD